jgi:hypothetical protein
MLTLIAIIIACRATVPIDARLLIAAIVFDCGNMTVGYLLGRR